MKKIKQTLLSLLLLTISLQMIGCSFMGDIPKERYSLEDFKNVAEEFDIEILYEEKESYEEDLDVEYDLYVSGMHEDEDLTIEYINFSSLKDAEYFYGLVVDNLLDTYENPNASSSVSLNDYEKQSITTKTAYFMIERIEDTIIYIESDKQSKPIAEDFMNALLEKQQ